MKVQKIISLDKETAELAAKKTNFSGWVRDQLRSERNKRNLVSQDDEKLRLATNESVRNRFDNLLQNQSISTGQLLYELEKRSADEIKALVAILKNVK
tara:strand:+ start:375 stop:668 length:294 start_codon:yes stop_codon:yes gene_type:complete